MDELYLLYGATFFGLGIVLAFQTRLPSTVVPRRALGLFAAFAVLHGIGEWTTMLALAHGAKPGPGALAVAILSWGLLAQFGVEVLGPRRGWPSWSRVVPGLVVVAWAVIAAVFIRSPVLHPASLRTIDAASRYGLALPAALLATAGFHRLGRDRGDDAVVRGLFKIATRVFFVYALVAGLVVPPAPFFPASVVNTAAFRGFAGLPVEIVRAFCAVTLALVLSRALVIEVSRRRRELERRREEFISVVAHDLRNPIGAIQLSADLLEKQIANADGADRTRAERQLRAIRNGAYGLERMVRDLLDASRIETRNLALDLHTLDPTTLIGEIVERAKPRTGNHAVKLVLPEDLPTIVADPLRVEQVLVNLLSNAAKFSAMGSEIVVEVVARTGELELAVTNQGAGLPPEDHDKVFSRFYRGKTHANVEGLGLGLYIAKGLVEAQGGRIWIESEVGRYATFRFTLPHGGLNVHSRGGTLAST